MVPCAPLALEKSSAQGGVVALLRELSRGPEAASQESGLYFSALAG
jgi:hypothetical protein